MDLPAEHRLKRTIAAGAIGNVLEWYDFGLFGFFAPVISRLFFPSQHELASLLGTYGVYATGFLMRPLGGLVFGHIGDRVGRKRALELSVLLMAVPTTLAGFVADLRHDRRLGFGPAHAISVAAGFERRRRIYRLDVVSIGACPAAPPCFSRKLELIQRRAGVAPRLRHGGRDDRASYGAATGNLGLARAVYRRHPDRAGGPVAAPRRRREPVVSQSTQERRPRRQPDPGSRAQATGANCRDARTDRHQRCRLLPPVCLAADLARRGSTSRDSENQRRSPPARSHWSCSWS